MSKGNPRRAVLAALAVLLALVIGDSSWAGISAARSLASARSHLQGGADALLAGDLQGARRQFRLASDDGGSARRLTWHPTALLGSVLPGIGNDVRAVRDLGRASELLGQAGEALVQAGAAAGWDGTQIPGMVSAGAFDLETIRRATPALATAAARMREARALLERSHGTLLGPVGGAVAAAKQALDEQLGVIGAAVDLSRVLPPLLGASGRRTYLLVVQNLADVRGSGGFPGSYATLTADHGHLVVSEFLPIRALGRVKPVDAPRDVRARYGRFGGLTSLTAGTYSPDFPTAARVMLKMWDATGRQPLDGVIAVDPLWMADMVGAIGPVTTPFYPEPLTSENVATVLLHDAFDYPYGDLGPSDYLQTAVGQAMWEALLSSPIPPEDFTDAMAKATAGRHFQVYSRRPGEERVLQDLGAAGRLELGRNPLFVAWQAAIDSRVGYFVHTGQGHSIVLHDDGSADVRSFVGFTNEADPAVVKPSILFGRGTKNDPLGLFAAYMNVYLPAGATGVRTHLSVEPTLIKTEREFGRRVLLVYAQGGPGSRVVLRVTYHVPHAAVRAGDSWIYRANLIPQPAQLWPEPVWIWIRAPGSIEGTSSEFRVDGNTAKFEGENTLVHRLWVRYSDSRF